MGRSNKAPNESSPPVPESFQPPQILPPSAAAFFSCNLWQLVLAWSFWALQKMCDHVQAHTTREHSHGPPSEHSHGPPRPCCQFAAGAWCANMGFTCREPSPKAGDVCPGCQWRAGCASRALGCLLVIPAGPAARGTSIKVSHKK